MKSVAANRITLSDAARRRMLAVRGEPMFYARWDRAVFIHYEADPTALRRDVPFELDLRNGRAFVSLVAFTLQRMRPRIGGRLAEWLLNPFATHEFLNVRTYVRHNGEPGIYFLAEWLSNPLSVRLGPRSFGLPYHFGRINYDHAHDGTALRGSIQAREGRLIYEGHVRGQEFEPCDPESITEFLCERYTAFTQHRRRARFFRVWHSPWPLQQAEIKVTADTLIGTTGRWWQTAQYLSAHYSPGAEVWMGRPHRLR